MDSSRGAAMPNNDVAVAGLTPEYPAKSLPSAPKLLPKSEPSS
jgi:hypothetical protein